MAENEKNVTTNTTDADIIVRVAAKSTPRKVAGAIASVFNKYGKAEVHAVGAAAINQAVKAIAIARGFLTLNGKNLITYPAFTTVNVEGEERTAIVFVVEDR